MGPRKAQTSNGNDNTTTELNKSTVEDNHTQTILQAIQESESKLINKLDTQINLLRESLTERLEEHENRLSIAEGNIAHIAEKQDDLDGTARTHSEEIVELKERIIANEAHNRRLNLHFMGINYIKDENVTTLMSEFMCDKLKMDVGKVDDIMKFTRDMHRLGRATPEKKSPPIIVAFIRQADRNFVLRQAINLKGTTFAIHVDLPKEWSALRTNLLLTKKAIAEVNREALVVLTYNTYKPVLKVKYRGKFQQYNPDTMAIADLQAAD